MFKKIKMWFEKRKGEKKSSIENADNQRLIIEKGAVCIDKPGQKQPYLIGYQELPTEKEENNYVSITIDGKTYDTSNQEEIAEILKYFSEQLRAKK